MASTSPASISAGAQPGGVNTIACNTSGGVGGDAGMPGASIMNLTSNLLNASNVDWDTPGPDQFSCNASLLVCTCQISSCTTTPDGMDVVVESSGQILTAGNGLAPTCAP